MNSYKIALIGDGGVGKTTFLKFLKTGEFTEKYLHTVGVEVTSINIADITLCFWDCAGIEKYAGLKDGYYIGADLVIIASSYDNLDSINNIAKWETAVRRISENIPIMYLMCKSDLKGNLTKLRNSHEISIKNDSESVSKFLDAVCKLLGKV